MEVGEDHERRRAGDAVRHQPRRGAGPAKQVIKAVSQHVLAVHAEPQARERDAELRRGDVAILLPGVVEDRLHPAGEQVSSGRAAIDRRPWDADDRELRRDEQAVEQDQAADDQELDHRACPFPA